MIPITPKAGLRPAARLLRREDGSMTVFALFVFVAMLLVAGLAVDMMRVEHERVRMQGATDRAVLAATMLRENISGASPEQIARAHLTAEGLADFVEGRIVVEEDGGGRRVTITPAATVPGLFTRMLGIDDLPLATPAQALEVAASDDGGPAEIEVVLVLDVTGSMGARTANGLTRIENLRNAARDLIEVLLRDQPVGRVALTIVPYAAEVIPPAGFINHFVNLPVGSGACVDFTTWTSAIDSFLQPVIRRNCATDPTRIVRPYLHDADAAIAVINGLQARGTTSIDLGVRFGGMFFDPTIGGAIQQMVDNGTVHPAFAGRPYAWNRPGVVRAMILMTDGANCCGARFPIPVQDANTISACTALKDQGVTIYTVAFEAPRAGVQLMQNCATSPNHFFNTSAAGIADAFAAVGNHIHVQAMRLRLTH